MYDYEQTVLAQSICPQPFRARPHKSTKTQDATPFQFVETNSRKRRRVEFPSQPAAPLQEPLLPEIKKINSSSGSPHGGQTVWICVQNLKRNQDILINFGENRNATVEYLSSEDDVVQFLECTTPRCERPCYVHLSIRSFHRPDETIASRGKVAFEYQEESLYERYLPLLSFFSSC